MKRLALALLMVAAAPAMPLLAAGPAEAQGVPEALRGTWARGSCTAPEALLHVTARGVVRLPAAGPARLWCASARCATRQAGPWASAPGQAPRVMLRPAEDAIDLAEPDAKLRDDRLPGETRVTRWLRCQAPGVGNALLHGEGLAFLGTLERLEAACQAGPPASCLAVLVSEADVSGDQRLSSVAEVARLLRGAAWALAVQQGSEQSDRRHDGAGQHGGTGGGAAGGRQPGLRQ